jgi:phosphoribosylaminoimidazole-succinocarboxamide synthase
MLASNLLYDPELSDSDDALLHTCFPGITLLRRGKNKDIYDLGDKLLMVSTDRLTAAGRVLAQGVKGKGRIVNQLSSYWFRKLRTVFPNHLVSAQTRHYAASIGNHSEILEGRSMLVRKALPLPVRCVVRGYLAGAGWREYQQTGEICGIKLPRGLTESQRLPFPIFTPKIKGSPRGMGENLSFESIRQLLGTSLAEELREASLRLYFTAWKSARERGVLIADTKFEFGFNNGSLMLIHECLTPDTSRFWNLGSYQHGGPMPTMDKQILIDYLDTLEGSASQAKLPERLLYGIGEKYYEAYKRIVARRAYSKYAIFKS